MFKRLKFRGGKVFGLGFCVGALIAFLVDALDDYKRNK